MLIFAKKNTPLHRWGKRGCTPPRFSDLPTVIVVSASLNPYWFALEFWNIEFDELDFLSISNYIFPACLACKNQVQARKKSSSSEFVTLNISNQEFFFVQFMFKNKIALSTKMKECLDTQFHSVLAFSINNSCLLCSTKLSKLQGHPPQSGRNWTATVSSSCKLDFV